MITILLQLCWAAPPAGLRPIAAPADAEALYSAAQPDAAPLVCDLLLPHLKLCFKVWEGKRRRWVTEADAIAWKTTPTGLREALAPKVAEILALNPQPMLIAGMVEQYWILSDSDGWAVAPLLDHGALAKRMGASETTPIRVAVPRAGVFLAWLPGSAEVDQVMAVAVREYYEAAEDAVTPMVYAWSGGRWRPFGTARPSVLKESKDGG